MRILSGQVFEAGSSAPLMQAGGSSTVGAVGQQLSMRRQASMNHLRTMRDAHGFPKTQVRGLNFQMASASSPMMQLRSGPMNNLGKLLPAEEKLLRDKFLSLVAAEDMAWQGIELAYSSEMTDDEMDRVVNQHMINVEHMTALEKDIDLMTSASEMGEWSAQAGDLQSEFEDEALWLDKRLRETSGAGSMTAVAFGIGAVLVAGGAAWWIIKKGRRRKAA